MLELQPIDHRGCRRDGPVLVNVNDIESVQPAVGDSHYDPVVGSTVRTRSGDTHRVAEPVKKIKSLLDIAMRGEQ